MDGASDQNIGVRSRNSILACMSGDLQSQFRSQAKELEVETGMVLFRKEDTIQFVYFPESAIVSMMLSIVDGHSSGLALTGNDGIVGFPLVLGQKRACHDAVVQNSGRILRVRKPDFMEALAASPEFQKAAMGYVRTVLIQMQAGLLCSHHFRVEEQLARWLLLTFERANEEELPLTQQTLADMLGVRREAVNEAARGLAERNLIHYRRGWIHILDPAGLKDMVAECYAEARRF